MKVLGLILVVLFSVSAFADGHEKGEHFEARKKHKVEMIDKRIAIMNTKKTCFSAATDKAAMKACRSKAKEAQKALKAEAKAWKKSRKGHKH